MNKWDVYTSTGFIHRIEAEKFGLTADESVASFYRGNGVIAVFKNFSAIIRIIEQADKP